MQHGYKTQHSTVMALHTLNNTVAKGFNQMAPPARTITVALDIIIQEEFIKQNFYKKKNKQNYYENKINYNIHYLHLS